MKIHILCNLRQDAWGGGNQFLKALRTQFIKLNIYTEDVYKADAVVFNSHHELSEILKIKFKYPHKLIIHRVDGPVFKVRNTHLELDKIIYKFNNLLADGTIFQSRWSQNENYTLGMKINTHETIILNAPDPEIFNKKNRVKFNKNRKIKLITTSWSSNPRKGFDIYQYLDENLNFSDYEMTFIGNSHVKFKNIKWIKPLNSEDLALQLKKYDIFITASKKDPCSNSLIEALHCGLPAVVLNDGGHLEIIGSGGKVFNNKHDVIEKIEKIINNYSYYQEKINLPDIQKIADEYYAFAKNIYIKAQNKTYNIKRINNTKLCLLLFPVLKRKLQGKYKALLKKCLLKI